ncbi:MAG: tyrosine-type recombinase/integrase, partial [Paracoccaceae bacterium]
LRQWKAELGLLRLSELTPDRIIKARDKLAKREGNDGPVSSSTVNRYHAALAHALTVAEKQYGWIEDNPMRRVPKLKEPQGRVRYLSDKERTALLDACGNSSNPFLLPIVLIAITTGMRRGEIENLTWDDIDWQQDRIVIHETKNSLRRSAPLLPMVKEVLARHRPENPEAGALVFPGRRGTRPIEIKKAWYGALSEAGIEPSVGSVGDSYDNALAEAVIGLFKTEVIRRRGPWRSLEAVEFATLEWVDWFNNRRLLEPIGNIPPAEAEARFYAQPRDLAMVA